MNNIGNNYQSMLDRYKIMVNQTENVGEKKANQDFGSLGLGESFGDLLSNKVTQLNDKQLEADGFIQDFVSGGTEDIHDVMIKVEEARMSMELAVQVRNKIVEAYKELNSLQL